MLWIWKNKYTVYHQGMNLRPRTTAHVFTEGNCAEYCTIFCFIFPQGYNWAKLKNRVNVFFMCTDCLCSWFVELEHNLFFSSVTLFHLWNWKLIPCFLSRKKNGSVSDQQRIHQYKRLKGDKQDWRFVFNQKSNTDILKILDIVFAKGKRVNPEWRCFWILLQN